MTIMVVLDCSSTKQKLSKLLRKKKEKCRDNKFYLKKKKNREREGFGVREVRKKENLSQTQLGNLTISLSLNKTKLGSDTWVRI